MISVDPGLKAGWASWGPFYLQDCGLVEKEWRIQTPLLVIERPTIYPRSPVPPDDIVALALTAGRLSAHADSVEWVLPRRWKGTVPKEVMAERILERLGPLERAIYDEAVTKVAPKVRHNVIDAIGLGLWYLKRIGTGGI